MTVGSHPRPAGRRAFSLVELVLVLAIILTVSAIAIPRYAGAATRYRLDGAARRIAADLALAQSQARLTSKSQPVSFDVAAGRYVLAGVPALDKGPGDYTVNLAADPYRVTLVSAGFGMVGTTVTFDAYGSPSSGGTVTVEAGGFQKQVLLNASTGKATVQ